MDMIPVESSNIKAVGYDADKKELHVTFLSGQTYVYSEVPPDKHSDLMAAERKGKHFHMHIRNNHAFRKVET